jgi:adenylate cyclase
LPEKIAAELKADGRSKAQKFEMVSVLFTDFKDFTKIAEKMSPENLVATLDTCFRGFDLIAEKHRIEKIKTIGDAYMCAAGLPEPRPSHALDLTLAALEMRDFMANFNENQQKMGLPRFEIRLGIHSGAVVAGVVGQKKFAWDIWGDAVNLAARMEQSGEPGKVNISETTRNFLPKTGFIFESRGQILAKNKGEVTMFFVEKRM